MKKLVLILTVIMLGMSGIKANPIPVPSVKINEFMFDDEKGWMLEVLVYVEYDLGITRLEIRSSSGKADVKYIPPPENYEYWDEFIVYTQDSMQSELNFNPLGDIVMATIFFQNENDFEESYSESLRYGDYPNVSINAPKQGQSIIYINGIEYLYYGIYY